MFTNEDYERLLVKYTSQGIPAGESIQHFCDRNKVPYNLFDKWYRDTRHKVVKVKVDGKPTTDTDSGSSLMGSIMDGIKPQGKPAERDPEWTEANPKPGSVAYIDQHPEEGGQKDTVRIMVDIRMSNGMQIRQRNLSRHQLQKLVENLEVLC